MNSSLRRALGVAAVAVTTGTGALAAQAPAPAPPPVSVSGVVFTQALYQLTDTLNHVNRFDITRAYINVIGKFSGGSPPTAPGPTASSTPTPPTLPPNRR